MDPKEPVVREAVAEWAADLLPQLVTGRGRELESVHARLGRKIGGLAALDVFSFRFEWINAPLRAQVRETWLAMLEGEIGAVGVAASEDGGVTVPVVEPDMGFCEKEEIEALSRCVLRELERSQVDNTTRNRMVQLWRFLEAWSLDADSAEKPPSARGIARSLQLPRERVASLLRQLGELVRVCRDANGAEKRVKEG